MPEQSVPEPNNQGAVLQVLTMNLMYGFKITDTNKLLHRGTESTSTVYLNHQRKCKNNVKNEQDQSVLINFLLQNESSLKTTRV